MAPWFETLSMVGFPEAPQQAAANHMQHPLAAGAYAGVVNVCVKRA
jgi:hypothetical protein